MTRKLLSGVWLAIFLLVAASPVSYAQDNPAAQMLKRMGHGVNILGYDGIWDGAINAPFRLSDFKRIRDAGFRHVRINLIAFKHMDANNRLDETLLRQLDMVLHEAGKAGLVPSVDEHDYGSCQDDSNACAIKLKAFWSQLSARYAAQFPDAIFEILNEPGGSMSQSAWNKLALEVLAAIRVSNPKRIVIVAVLNTEDAHQASQMVLPAADRNIILTWHYYKPFRFTHQGAPWSPEVAGLHNIHWGSGDDEERVLADFKIIDEWAKSIDRPVYLGEFGVYDKADMQDRARYLSFISKTAERFGWDWAYWQFDHDFALFDRTKDQWNRPILKALIPSGSK